MGIFSHSASPWAEDELGHIPIRSTTTKLFFIRLGQSTQDEILNALHSPLLSAMMGGRWIMILSPTQSSAGHPFFEIILSRCRDEKGGRYISTRTCADQVGIEIGADSGVAEAIRFISDRYQFTLNRRLFGIGSQTSDIESALGRKLLKRRDGRIAFNGSPDCIGTEGFYTCCPPEMETICFKTPTTLNNTQRSNTIVSWSLMTPSSAQCVRDNMNPR